MSQVRCFLGAFAFLAFPASPLLAQAVYKLEVNPDLHPSATLTLEGTQIRRSDLKRLGDLFVRSHVSMRDDYEISTPEIDLLVDLALADQNVYGARMTGAGFGGCIVALAQPRSIDTLTERLMKSYPEQFGKEPQVYVTTATAGVGVIE